MFTPRPQPRPTPHPETHYADPMLPLTCREPGCTHITGDDAFPWKSPGCHTAWLLAWNAAMDEQRQAAS